MAAHRYWRVVSLEAYGEGDLELSCFHLLAAGVRVDDTATLTSNIAPTTGALASLQDDNLTTAALWPAVSVSKLVLQWDFGVGGKDLNDIRLAGNSGWRFPLLCKLQWSDAGVAWTDYYAFAGITYPGAGVKTASAAFVEGAIGGIVLNKIKGRAASSSVLSIGSGPIITYGTPSINPLTVLTVESGSVKDYVTGVLGQGIGRVRGTVKLKNTPVNTPLMRRVRLIRERDGLQVRETWSDPITGEYDFQYIDELQTWTVVSYDHAHDKRAVIADNLTLANGGVELMP